MLVLNDASDFILEAATYCKPNDEKRPELVGAPPGSFGPSQNQICPDDMSMGATEVTDALPTAFYGRVMFDELLNPDIEDLTAVIDPDSGMPDGTYTGTIARTQPFTFNCGGADIAYDGFYDPSGNNVSWPLGPSLVIAPTDYSTVATGSECSLTLKDNILDKQGNPVPADQRGPYKWKISALEFVGSDPAAPDDPTMPDTVDPAAPLVLFFNAYVNPASLEAGTVKILEVADCSATTGVTRTASIMADPSDPTAIDISDAGAGAGLAFQPEKTYLITFNGSTVSDTAATPGTVDLPGAADYAICFQTDMAQ